MSEKLKSIRATLVLALLLIAGSVHAQQTVKVNVKDSSGEAVIGASIIEKGTKNGGITDFDGNFTLKSTGKPVTISYVGMKTKTVDVKGKTSINVVLEDDNTTLNDVVVIGYGTVRKKDLTGSVSSLSSKQVENIPVSNISEAMTGKMAGVNITTTEGSPDADVKIRVRGGGSLSQDNSPLYIVDGFPVSSIGDIARLVDGHLRCPWCQRCYHHHHKERLRGQDSGIVQRLTRLEADNEGGEGHVAL